MISACPPFAPAGLFVHWRLLPAPSCAWRAWEWANTFCYRAGGSNANKPSWSAAFPQVETAHEGKEEGRSAGWDRCCVLSAISPSTALLTLPGHPALTPGLALSHTRQLFRGQELVHILCLRKDGWVTALTTSSCPASGFSWSQCELCAHLPPGWQPRLSRTGYGCMLCYPATSLQKTLAQRPLEWSLPEFCDTGIRRTSTLTGVSQKNCLPFFFPNPFHSRAMFAAMGFDEHKFKKFIHTNGEIVCTNNSR